MQLLAGTSDEDNTMSEYSGECTDSGRGHSAAGLSSWLRPPSCLLTYYTG